MKKQVIHHVLFWLKNPDSKEDLNKLVEGLKTLQKIETIRKFNIGVPAATEPRPVVDASYSVSLLQFFDDIEGQNIYQEHPLHISFVNNYSKLWSRVVVFDSSDVWAI